MKPSSIVPAGEAVEAPQRDGDGTRMATIPAHVPSAPAARRRRPPAPPSTNAVGSSWTRRSAGSRRRAVRPRHLPRWRPGVAQPSGGALGHEVTRDTLSPPVTDLQEAPPVRSARARWDRRPGCGAARRGGRRRPPAARRRGVAAPPTWHPVLDLAMTEFRVRDVGTSHTPLIGLPGRIGTYPHQGSHPGPAQLLPPGPDLPAARVETSWSLEVGTVVIHLAAIATALWIGWRRAGWRGVAVVAAAAGDRGAGLRAGRADPAVEPVPAASWRGSSSCWRRGRSCAATT